MFSDQLVLQGKIGVERLDHWGPYTVIVNRTLYEQGTAGKYTVVNAKELWIDSVHRSRAAAANEARQLYSA